MITKKIYNGKKELKFDPVKHKYWIDGERVELSSTRVTGIIDKSAPLMGWAIKMMAQYLVNLLNNNIQIGENEVYQAKREYRKAQKKAADIGSAIHQWIEDWIKGENPEMPDDENIVNGITAFLKWKRNNNIEFIESEEQVYSEKYNYIGTFDAIAKIDGKLAIIDFKSSSGIYNEMRYQLASYWHAWEEMTDDKFDEGYIVQFDKKTGNFDPDKNILKISRKEYKKDFDAFVGALKIKQREKELKF